MNMNDMSGVLMNLATEEIKILYTGLMMDRRIFLLKPHKLKLALISQLGWTFDGITERPSHPGIFEDLRRKKKERPEEFPRIVHLIEEVFNDPKNQRCKDFPDERNINLNPNC